MDNWSSRTVRMQFHATLVHRENTPLRPVQEMKENNAVKATFMKTTKSRSLAFNFECNSFCVDEFNGMLFGVDARKSDHFTYEYSAHFQPILVLSFQILVILSGSDLLACLAGFRLNSTGGKSTVIKSDPLCVT